LNILLFIVSIVIYFNIVFLNTLIFLKISFQIFLDPFKRSKIQAHNIVFFNLLGSYHPYFLRDPLPSIILAFRNHPHFLRVSTSTSLPWPLLSSPCLGSWRWQRSNQFQFFSPTCEFEATSGPLRLIGGQDFWKWLVTSGRICAVSHDNLQCLEPPNTHLNSNRIEPDQSNLIPSASSRRIDFIACGYAARSRAFFKMVSANVCQRHVAMAMEIIISTTDPNTQPHCQNKKHAKEYWKSVDATEKWMLSSRNSMAAWRT